jgi:hypothetical protein
MPGLRPVLQVVVFMVVLVTAAVPGPPVAWGQPRFSSAFTHLNRDCQDAVGKETGGEDIPQKCKGYGRYYVFIYYSAYGCHIAIKNKDNEEMIYIAPEHFDFSRKKDSVVEWRLADGQPFAVIIKVARYHDSKAQEKGDNPFQPRYKIGDVVLVKGLAGYSRINFALNARSQPDPLAKARALADEAYLKGSGS